MTTYRVVITEQAARELEAAADWWAANRSMLQAAEWYQGFSERIASLRESPDRLPLADENTEFSYEIRELHYGVGARATHRAIYTIVSSFVVVLTIRHAAQGKIRPSDFDTSQYPA